MNSLITAALAFLLPYASYAENDALVETLFAGPYSNSVYGDYMTMADRIRICQPVPGVGTNANYILQCLKRTELTSIQETPNVQRLFFADNDIINAISTDDRYLYINVLTDVQNPGQMAQTCYRVIRELDEARDGYYAVEVCDYN
ncbi:MAG: hypothetical protein LBF37_00830 [Rickettsiales bacterium]|jgi:hypothetical protein|nr:hypothetical protein [Rickettsiales bacterium]